LLRKGQEEKKRLATNARIRKLRIILKEEKEIIRAFVAKKKKRKRQLAALSES
jgi:hypothetical protein